MTVATVSVSSLGVAVGVGVSAHLHLHGLLLHHHHWLLLRVHLLHRLHLRHGRRRHLHGLHGDVLHSLHLHGLARRLVLRLTLRFGVGTSSDALFVNLLLETVHLLVDSLDVVMRGTLVCVVTLHFMGRLVVLDLLL